MTSYEIVFTDTALKQMKKLDMRVQERVISVLERIRVHPERYVRRLVDEPYYRLRVGDYRVILDIVHGKMIVMVLYVSHRRNVYGGK